MAWGWARGLLRSSAVLRESTRTPHGRLSDCSSLLQLPPGPPPWPPPTLARGLTLADPPGLKHPPQPRFPEIPAAPSPAAGMGSVGPCSRRHPGRGLAARRSSRSPPFVWPARPRGLQPLRGKHRSSFALVFRGEKGQKGHFRASLSRPFLRLGGVSSLRGSPPLLALGPAKCGGEGAGPARARRIGSTPERHWPAGPSAFPRPRAPRTGRGATGVV